MPVACGGTTRKLDPLPLLLLPAPSARVRSSPRTFPAAASPAAGGGRRAGPRGTGPRWGRRLAGAGTSVPARCGPGSSLEARAQDAQAGGARGPACGRWALLHPSPRLRPRTRAFRETRPWVLSATLDAAQRSLPAPLRANDLEREVAGTRSPEFPRSGLLGRPLGTGKPRGLQRQPQVIPQAPCEIGQGAK